MHMESIHRYLIFKALVIPTASANVFGRTAKGICVFRVSKLSFVVFIISAAVSPQQWLKHMYGACWPFETKRWGSSNESGAPTSMTREGRVCHSLRRYWAQIL